ncbi:DUF6930 domain-containing protein [Bacillus andreraoultii]|uniref:DUF6930 domain-containing protein n=1 Tax=Bacillus andreraoultii TaxID=1499685 RepID=UPI00053AA449|nr:hypothetical protein [Bacillus andreraoultii]
MIFLSGLVKDKPGAFQPGHTEDYTETVQNSNIQHNKQIEGIPWELWVKKEGAKVIEPVCKKFNSQLLVVKNLPIIEDALE